MSGVRSPGSQPVWPQLLQTFGLPSSQPEGALVLDSGTNQSPVSQQLSQSQTGSYQAGNLAPASMEFSNPICAEALRQGIQNFDQLSGPQRNQLESLATQLGFSGARSLTHALRHLPAAALNSWLASLPAQPSTPEALQSARQNLAEQSKALVVQFFADQQLPAPRFEGDASRWDASSYLAVFNSISEMQASLPNQLFRNLAAPQGKPLTFERRQQPLVSPVSAGNLMQTLSGCMCIAHSDGKNRIVLYDPAISMNPQDILKRPEIQNFMGQLNQPNPDADSVRSFQKMLNLTLPPGRELPENGQLTPACWQALQEFESNQALRQTLDIVRDDQRLTQREKQQLSQQLEEMLEEMRSEGAEAAEDLPELLASLRSKLSPAGQERLTTLEAIFKPEPDSRQLKPQQLELLIRNWFGMIDSGQQFDFGEQVINHEMGHLLQGQGTLLDNWSKISFRDFDSSRPNSEFMGTTLDNPLKSWGIKLAESVGLNFNLDFGTDYARVSPAEDFAESFRLFSRDPERLAAENPLKFTLMAGITGAYQGKERELVDLLKRSGHSEIQLKNMVRILRGQSTSFVAQQAKSITESGYNWLSRIEGALNPAVGIARWFGFDPLSKQGQQMGEKAAQLAANVSGKHTPQFNLEIATLLPGLEASLGMQTNVRAVLPSQVGYVLDWLTQQTRLQQNSPDPQIRARAQNLLDRFSKEGLSVFSPEIQRQLPADLKTRVSQPETRAILMALAQIQAAPQRLSNWAQQLAEAGKYCQEANPGHRFSDAELETLLGTEFVQNLPKAFKSILRDPGILEKISGFFGQIQIDSTLLINSLDSSLDSRQAELEKARSELTDTSQSSLLTRLAGTFSRQGDQIRANSKQALALHQLGQVFEKIKANTDLNFEYGEAQGRAMIEFMIRGLSQYPPEQTAMNSSNPEYMHQLQHLLLDAVGQQYPDLLEQLEQMEGGDLI